MSAKVLATKKTKKNKKQPVRTFARSRYGMTSAGQDNYINTNLLIQLQPNMLTFFHSLDMCCRENNSVVRKCMCHLV